MSEEIVKATSKDVDVPKGVLLDVLDKRTKEMEVGEKIQQLLISDMEEALNLLVGYQEILKRLLSPDPQTMATRLLLNRYKMAAVEPTKMYQILLDGRDITTHPDSIPGTAVEETETAPELEDKYTKEEEVWGEEAYGIEDAEFVAERDKDGDHLRLKPAEKCARCDGPLDTKVDPYFRYVGTVTNTETGHVENLCDKCIMKEFND